LENWPELGTARHERRDVVIPGVPAEATATAYAGEVNASDVDERLSADVALVQRMVSLGRAARQQANARVRQPLAEAVLVPRTEVERDALQRLADQVADELTINAADAAQIASRMRAGEPLRLGDFDLAAGDLLVSVDAADGWSAAEEAGYVALVDTRVTPELEAEGMARELVRRLQDLRREAGLEVTDRIRVTWRGDDAVGKVFAEHGPTIADEVLALSLDAGDGNGAVPGGASTEADIEGHAVTLALQRA
jgi:isoleucyl-tRNA synthetase